jgi:hypothetical protein
VFRRTNSVFIEGFPFLTVLFFCNLPYGPAFVKQFPGEREKFPSAGINMGGSGKRY